MKKHILPLTVVCALACLTSCYVTNSELAGSTDISSVTKALEGKVNGVMFNNLSGNPDKSPDILIRGFNSINADTNPTIVLDGMIYEGPLSLINPNDIESIRVLKDASETVIYGFRGANGIIEIKTKKGGTQPDQNK